MVVVLTKKFSFSFQNFLDQICKQDHYYFFQNSVRSAFDEDVASEASRMTTGLFSKMSKPKYCNTASDEKK